jgi:hypothetical protein
MTAANDVDVEQYVDENNDTTLQVDALVVDVMLLTKE